MTDEEGPKRDRRERGEGTWLPPAKDGRYRYQVSFGLKRDGTRDRRVFVARTKKECRALAAEALQKKRGGLEPITGNTMLADYLDTWLENRSGLIERSTYETYEPLVRLHIAPSIGRVRLEDLRRTHVERVMTEIRAKGLSPRSANKARALLFTALDEAEEEGYVTRNHARRAKRAQGRSRPGLPLTVAEITRLFLSLQHRLEAEKSPKFRRRIRARTLMYLVTVTLGLRQGEVLGLQWDDWRMEEIYIQRQLKWDRLKKTFYLKRTKTDESVAPLPLTPNLVAALGELRVIAAEDREAAGDAWQKHWPDLIFRTGEGRPYHGSSITHQFEEDVDRAGLRRHTFHDLRHSTSTVLLHAGVDGKVRQAILRHASIATTLGVYTHPDAELMRDGMTTLDSLFGVGAGDNGNPDGNEARREQAK